MRKSYLTIETKNTIFHRESFSRKDVKDVFGKQRIREKSEDLRTLEVGRISLTLTKGGLCVGGW